MTAFDHIKCSNCCNWSRRSDKYGECVVMMGRKVDIFFVPSGMEGSIVDRVETQDDFFCATFSPVPILK